MKSNRSDSSPYARLVEAARPRFGRLASRLIHVETTASTNDVALAACEEGVIVIADRQTAGRGRRGHTWFSPPGAGLYVSVVLAPARAQVDPRRATMLTTIAAGVAIAEGIEQAAGLRTDLKWPNDVYINRRKLAGILAETGRDDLVVVGYGINVATAVLPPELHDRASSLELELGRSIDAAPVLIETLAALARRYADLLAGRFDVILDEWRRRAPAASGVRVSWAGAAGPLTGVTAGVDDDGALLVRVGARIERIVGGEVTWS